MTSAVRTTRARIIRLKNDYKELMSHIEKGLHEHHARLQERQSQTNQTTAAQGAQAAASGSAPPPALEPPFAKVNSVLAGSPAEAAGLQVGDSITKFGWVDWTNHDKLARLTQVVSQNEGVSNTTRHWLWLRPLRGAPRQCEDMADNLQLPVVVKALRPSAAGPSETIEMRLTPRRNWGGRGMLGCNLLPL